MAIDVNFARFLVTCRQKRVNFAQTLTLGRLNYYLGTRETKQLLRWAGMDLQQHSRLLDYKTSRHAETFFQSLGAVRVESLDASGFEGASIVHDLNVPVPESLKDQFDTVCDAGTIEHVINFPVVVSNAMQMVKVGGHLILGTPANNLFGHGFYQFSPELWFRLLSPERGFEMQRMIAVEYGPRARWFEVADPDVVKDRVVLTNRRPVLLMIVAQKLANKPIFDPFPQQSDYVPRWQGAGDPANRRRALEVWFRRRFLEVAPRLARALENFYQSSWFNQKHSLRNRKFFKPVQR
jgi:hypothetical protein